jgi:hypothetical protein
MVIQQDSTHPTGVSVVTGNEREATSARTRKARAGIQLALAGATWDEIAESLGYPTARMARVAIEKALEHELDTTQDRDYLRRFASMRLDRLLRAVWPKAIDPDHPDQLAFHARAESILGKYSKLHGLDAPTEITVYNPAEAEMMNWVQQMQSLGKPPVVEYDILASKVEDAEVIEAEELVDFEEDLNALPHN